ncbi:MAG: DUF882 domain-containing protein [Candidatus Sulfotelmatobacter sp.]
MRSTACIWRPKRSTFAYLGISTSELRDAALRLHRGGVGYYRGSDFVHVDVGRVRHW